MKLKFFRIDESRLVKCGPRTCWSGPPSGAMLVCPMAVATGGCANAAAFIHCV